MASSIHTGIPSSTQANPPKYPPFIVVIPCNPDYLSLICIVSVDQRGAV